LISRDETQLDPEAFRDAGHRLVDRLADYLARAMRGEMPVLPWADPGALAAEWPASFPAEAGGAAALEALVARAIAEANHLHHPRYVGHQVTSPLPLVALSALPAALLNNSMAVYEMGPGATAMERAVIRFLAGTIGFGGGADGVLTSGGSAGNLTALLAARQAKAGWDAWMHGDHGGPPLAVLGSAQAHYSIGRAAQIMGWGSGGFVPVPVDARYRMRADALDAAMRAAESEGRKVIAVAASACSTATGSFDPLPEIAAFAAERGLWMHVDGAHGASAALSSKHRHLVAGIERADSVVWDAHKMMLVPSLVTAVLFREGGRSYEAFAQEASYLFALGHDRAASGPKPPRASAREEVWFDIGRRTLECTKRMMSLELYAALATAGTRFFDEYVTATFDLAARFAARLERELDFELPVEPACNIVCFRHRPSTIADDGALDRLQVAIRRRLIADGAFYLAQTALGGRVYLRVTLINPLTTDADLEALVYRIREAGLSLTSDAGAG
jgi:L-2,4-diaminobutyrate decarboxylase